MAEEPRQEPTRATEAERRVREYPSPPPLTPRGRSGSPQQQLATSTTSPTHSSARRVQRPSWMTRRTLIVFLVFVAGIPVSVAWALGVGYVTGQWASQSGDYIGLDSYASYAVANVIHTTPRELAAGPGKYAMKIVQLDNIEAKTLVVDSHVGGLQGSIQFSAYAAGDRSTRVLLVDVNSYVTPECTADDTIGCPRSLGDRMEMGDVGAVARYDKIQGRWLPISKYPIPQLRRQPADQYALWVAKAWLPGAIGPR
jgi:hypothetical protein